MQGLATPSAPNSDGITAIIPNWNGEVRLGALLQDIAGQIRPVSRVVVIDNGSSDGSIRVARAHGAEVIALPENRGFAYAVNRGIEVSTTSLVAVLNNDIRLPPDWVATLCGSLAADPAAAFATGKIYRITQETPDRRLLDGSFDAICRGGCAWRCGSGRTDGELWSHPGRIHMAPFTAVVFRRSLFDDLGRLDEAFESYLEDVDFGIRCALAGRYGLYVPQTAAGHWGSATLGVWHPATVRRIARNQVYLIARHYPKKWVARYGWPVLAAQLLWGVLAFRHGYPLAWLRGKLEGLCRFRSLRRAGAAPEAFAGMVELSERMLFDLQRQTGFDLYWKLYFALVRRP